MPTSKKMKEAASRSSLVRKMFEDGAKMKAQFGAENVFDYSIGNPDLAPPPIFKEKMLALINSDKPGMHGYMPNAGWLSVREKIAAYLTKEQGAGLKNNFAPNHIIMTCGAAGGLNVIFKSILDAGDEVISPKPCFMEYNFYADNHGGKLVLADSKPDFQIDVKAIAAKITKQTRAVLINSPHNPTGVIYTKENLAELAKVLTDASLANGRPIILIADEPYRKLAYDGAVVPSVFPLYPYSLVVTSYSKDMSVPGERIGYIAVNPDMPDQDSLINAMIMSNRILGFVSAPSTIQLVIGELQGCGVDVDLYKRRRDLLGNGLKEIGYDLNMPQGAFYLFPKAPMSDDTAFIEILKEEKIIGVPGAGFSQPGYFRLCYCVPEDMIKKSLPAFERAFKKAAGK